MSRFRQRITHAESVLQRKVENAQREFLSEALDAAQEDTIERVRAAFASAMPAPAQRTRAESDGDAAVRQLSARSDTSIRARAADALAPTGPRPVVVPRAIAAACPAVAACVAAHPGISASRVESELGMHRRKVQSALRVLKTDGVIQAQRVTLARGGWFQAYSSVTLVPSAGDAVADLASAPTAVLATDLGPIVEPDHRREADPSSIQRGSHA